MNLIRTSILLVAWTPLGLVAQSAAPAPAATPAPAAAATSGVSPQQFQWAQMDRYHDADAQLAPPAPGEKRVVFMGDSITDAWRGDVFFPGKNYIDRGISGQTTTQMLVRFPQDVVGLHPAVVLILAGTNDIAQNQGPITLDAIAANIESLATMARQNHIRPVICSILPSFNFPWHGGLQPAGKIKTVNGLLKTWCATHHVIFCDYYPALVDAQGGMQPSLSQDGVHPNAAGYTIMEPIAQAAIDKALKHR